MSLRTRLHHLLKQLCGVGHKLPAKATDVAAVLAQLLLHLPPPLLNDGQRCLRLHAANAWSRVVCVHLKCTHLEQACSTGLLRSAWWVIETYIPWCVEDVH